LDIVVVDWLDVLLLEQLAAARSTQPTTQATKSRGFTIDLLVLIVPSSELGCSMRHVAWVTSGAPASGNASAASCSLARRDN
jgi:hypothetical protein